MHAKMDIISVLRRVKTGETDIDDAQMLRRILIPDNRGETVKSYLWLRSHTELAREYIAPDLRQLLAKELIEDISDENTIHTIPA